MSKKSFQVSIDFLGNISDLQNKIKTLSGDLSKISGVNGGAQVQKTFDQLSQSIQNLQTKAKQPITSQGEFNKLVAEVNKVEGSYNNLVAAVERLYNLSDAKKLELLPKAEQQRIKDAANAVKAYEANTKKAASSIKELKDAQEKANTALDNQTAAQKTFKSLTASASKAQKEYEKLQAASKNLSDAQKEYNKLVTDTGAKKEGVSNEDFSNAATKLVEAKGKADELKGSYDKISTAAQQAKRQSDALANQKLKAQQDLTKAEETAKRLSKELEELKQKLESTSGQQLQSAFEQLKNKAKELGVSLEGIDDISSIDELTQRLLNLESQGLNKVNQGLLNTAENVQSSLSPALQTLRGETEKNRESFDSFTRAMNDVEGLKSRIGYFFSMTNSLMLLRRALMSSLETVKELDAVMTETAVVTDFSVGDMWDKLPEYSKQATALGASIRDLYGATTLYYQQGLQSEAAMSVGVETMKMARIAGMDAADATEAMTAALRGFNMEVNEMNAQRVNDVYSELAAITAADTEQIATAMSKTASIASSANMEFETTAALLAQIIETTQEAPETAGTAMKTIIARFTEVKQLFSEGMLTGEDDEGEEININKIDAALKTVGISLKDFLNGSKGIDTIFLELASKWDSLDLATQRYIATMAAGSRQQSRFIAMMSNYDRTMELVTAANNSAGASQEQFDKTLESMEAKLQKLKNAWDEFAMGLANNEILKAGVDILTFLLETVNKLTTALSGENGLAKSIINLATVIGALKGGAAIIGKIFGEGRVDITTGKGNQFGFGKTKTSQQIPEASEREAYSNGQKAGQAFRKGYEQAIQGNISVGSYTQTESGFLASKIIIKDEDAIAKNQEKINQVRSKMTSPSPEVAMNLDAYENELDSLEQKQEQLSQGTNALQINFTNLGMAVTGAGTAVSLLGGLFEKLGAEDLGKALKDIGGAITGIGSAFMLLGPMLNKTGLSIGKLGISFAKAGAAGAGAGTATVIGWAPILGTLLPIIAALGLLAAIFVAVRNSSPEYQLKQAAEASDQAAEAANNAAQAYEDLKSSLDSIASKETTLENLAVGTQEWKDAVAELNNEILDLMTTYPELSEFITSEGGVLTISETGKEAVLDRQLQAKQDTQAAKVGAEIAEQIAQQNVDYANLDYSLKIKEKKDVYNPETEEYINTVDVENRELTEQLARDFAAGIIDINDESLSFVRESGGEEEFLAFGRALNSSQQAIDTFAESLMGTAMVNADVSEEFRKQIGGMYDAQAIEAMIKEYERDTSALTEEDKRQYAQAKGWTYEDGVLRDEEGKKKNFVFNDVKKTLAPAKVQEELANNIKALENSFSILENSSGRLGKAFANVITEADGAGLTLEDLSNMKDQFSEGAATDEEGNVIWSQALEDAYAAVEGIYDRDTFYRIFSEAYAEAEALRADSETKMASIGLDASAYDAANIDTGSFANLVNEIYGVFLTSGGAVATDLSNLLSTIMTEEITDPEQAQLFADALGMIDWSDTDSIEGLSDILLQLGFDSDAAGVDIEVLEQQIISAARATKKFDLEALKEEIKSAQDLVDDLQDRENHERTFTQEERDLMVAANEGLASDFVMTGIDEFVYVGDSMGSLIEALNSNTAALLGKYGEQVTHDAEMSRKWQEIADSDRHWWKGKEDYGTEYQVLRDIATGERSASEYNETDLFSLMRQAGMEFKDEEITGNATLIADLIAKSFELYGTEAQRTQAFQAEEEYNNNLSSIQYANMSPQEILNQQSALPEEKAETEVAKTEALDAKLALQKNGIQEYEEALESMGDGFKDFKNLMKAAVLGANEYDKKLKNMTDSIKDNEDALKDSNKENYKYQQALTDITAAAKEVFGDNITQEFVEENLPAFLDLANGVEGASERIKEALSENLISSLEEAGEYTATELNAVKNAIAGLDGLNFDIYGNADASQIFTELAAVMGSADAAAAAIRAMGYSVTWVPNGYTEIYIPRPNSPNGFLTQKVPNYKTVVTDNTGRNYSGGGGGGGGGEPEKWENPYDEFYNSVEKLNEELRTREKLERRYQKLLDSSNTKASDLVKNAREQISSLEKERKMRQDLLAGRERQMVDIESEYSDLSGYASYNESKQVIEIDWAKIQSLDGSTDEELTSKIEEYIEKLEEQQELIEEEQDAIAEIEDAVKDIREQGKDQYFDLESQIREAIEQARQEEIDKLSAINDSITETNSRLIEAMQASVDKYRQDRENDRTEEELSDKQRRLAYLQQDTSGANAMEILKLQEEISQGQEDYTDSLVDQKITELQDQNDRAAEQREEQIELMQAQLDQWLSTGAVWDEVYSVMRSGIGPDGIIAGSQLESILMKGASFEAMSNLEKVKWMEETENLVAEAVSWLAVGNSVKALKDAGQLKQNDTISFTTSDGKTMTGTVSSSGTVTSGGQEYSGVYQTYNGSYTTSESFKTTPVASTPAPAPVVSKPAPSPAKSYPYGKASEISKNVAWGSTGNDVKAVQYALNELGYRAGEIDGIFGQNTYNAVLKFQKDAKTNGWNPDIGSPDGIVGPRTRKAFAFKEYKTGGLADFTGPAWLDGTKSKPEYILNAEQTKAFFSLVDVLEGFSAGRAQSSQNNGDSIYDVDINVETIGNDYDVEQLANTIKRMINDDARYRNNNAINLSR